MRSQLDTYVNALIPEPYTILGMELKPYSLGHFFLMRKFSCGFANENENALGDISDLILGLAICSQTYEGFLNCIETNNIQIGTHSKYYLFGPQVPTVIKYTDWIAEWGRLVEKKLKEKNIINMLECINMFKTYMRDSIVIPKFWETEHGEDAPSSGAHWTQSVLSILTSDCGYSQSEALNIPMSRALSDYFKFSERNGMLTLMNDDELEQIAELEKEKK